MTQETKVRKVSLRLAMNPNKTSIRAYVIYKVPGLRGHRIPLGTIGLYKGWEQLKGQFFTQELREDMDRMVCRESMELFDERSEINWREARKTLRQLLSKYGLKD